jgi:hypothetical protein
MLRVLEILQGLLKMLSYPLKTVNSRFFANDKLQWKNNSSARDRVLRKHNILKAVMHCPSHNYFYISRVNIVEK